MTTNDESSRVSFIESVKRKLISQKNNSENSSSSHSLSEPCIFKVTEELRKLNKSAYDPHVVSIGPIHKYSDDDKEEQRLNAMEHIKVAYTKELLCRIAGKSASPVDECLTAMLNSEARALNCYHENLKPIIKKNSENRLAEILLIDGCFILELLYRAYLVKTGKRIPKGDQLFGNRMIMLGIRHDLLLLENQLPFFILKDLFSITINRIPDHPWPSCPSLAEFVLSFFRNVTNFNNDYSQSTTINPEGHKCFHILHLIHNRFHILHLTPNCYLPTHAPEPSPTDAPNHPPKHRASDLDCAGVEFEAVPGKDQFDVNFKKASGLLWWRDSAKFEIPPLSISDLTEPLLRNLIAFEQCCGPSLLKCRHITSYASLMDSLIDSAADVELLEKNKIINNYLGSSKEASVLFNNICKHVVLGKFDFAKQCDDADIHCRRHWPKFLKSLKRDYFYNPWSVIAVVAAFILFAIAVVQTVYALLTYYGVEYETVRELHDMHSVL